MSLNPIQMAFVRFLALPPEERGFPSEEAFAQAYGVSSRTLRNWKNKPEFAHELERARKDLADDEMLVDRYRHEAAKDRLFHLMQEGGSTGRQAARDLATLTKDVVEEGRYLTYKGMSDAELLAVILDRDDVPPRLLEEVTWKLSGSYAGASSGPGCSREGSGPDGG